MKKEKIEELFIANAAFSYCGAEMMDIEDFTQAINQAELEWYKRLERKLNEIGYSRHQDVELIVRLYHVEIQNKIKEMENDN